MTKEKNAGAAPVSKYAARRKAAIEAEQKVSEIKEAVVEEQANINVKSKETSKGINTKKSKPGIPESASIYPEHVVNISLLIKNNAEIRRFTALGILNYLLQKGEIKGSGPRYVSFKWNKFSVKSNGLVREFLYSEPFFLNCLVASFSSFSASAQKTIDTFARREMNRGISDACSNEEINNIVELNEDYVTNKKAAEVEYSNEYDE